MDTITNLASTVGSSPASRPTHSLNGRSEKSTRVTFSVRYSAPKRAAWARNVLISSGPMIPSTKPG